MSFQKDKNIDFLVSIIVPVFNGEKYIEECITSISLQRYPCIEIIIVNDGSTDNTAEILNRVTDNRVKIFTIPNQGVSAARNKGLENATGTFITFIDADDTIAPNHIEGLVHNIVEKECDLAISSYTTHVFRSIPENNGIRILSSNDNVIEMFKKSSFQGFTWNRLFKREIIESNSLHFDRNISMLEDMLFNLEYLMRIKKIVFVDVATYYYRPNNDSAMLARSFGNKFQKNWLTELDSYKKMKQIIFTSFKECYSIFKESYIWEINTVRLLIREAPNFNVYESEYFQLTKFIKMQQHFIYRGQLFSNKEKFKFFLLLYIPSVLHLKLKISNSVKL